MDARPGPPGEGGGPPGHLRGRPPGSSGRWGSSTRALRRLPLNRANANGLLKFKAQLFPKRRDGKRPSQLRGGTWNILGPGNKYPRPRLGVHQDITSREGALLFNTDGGNRPHVRPDIMDDKYSWTSTSRCGLEEPENTTVHVVPANLRGTEFEQAYNEKGPIWYKGTEVGRGWAEAVERRVQRVLDQPGDLSPQRTQAGLKGQPEGERLEGRTLCRGRRPLRGRAARGRVRPLDPRRGCAPPPGRRPARRPGWILLFSSRGCAPWPPPRALPLRPLRPPPPLRPRLRAGGQAGLPGQGSLPSGVPCATGGGIPAEVHATKRAPRATRLPTVPAHKRAPRATGLTKVPHKRAPPAALPCHGAVRGLLVSGRDPSAPPGAVSPRILAQAQERRGEQTTMVMQMVSESPGSGRRGGAALRSAWRVS